MTDKITFGSKETGESASARIHGGADKVSVSLYRGSHETKHYDIYLHPSIFREIWDQIHNIGVGIHNNPREYYNAKIRDVVKHYSMIAKRYVAKDRQQVINELEKQKSEKESYEDHKKYIDSLIAQIERKVG